MTDELAAFLADGVGHNDDGAVAPDRAYERESDTLIAARRLDDDRVVVNQTLLLRLNDHIQRGARLDGAAYIERLELDENVSAVLVYHAVQSNQRGLTYRFQYVVINHVVLPHF